MSAVLDHVSTFGSRPLPNGWRAVTLEDILGDGGVFVDGDWVESKDQDPSGHVRLIQLADIGDGEYRDRSDRFLTSGKASDLRCTFLEPGDLLIARMPYPLGRACIFPGDRKRAVTVVDVAVVRPRNPELNTRWLMHCINAPQFRRIVASLQSGSTRQRISRKNLARIVFPLPPRHWQDEIVAEIEKQFSRLNEAMANLKRVKANLNRYKTAVLNAAVGGCLVASDARIARDRRRALRSGADLLAALLQQRREQWAGRGKYKVPAPVPEDVGPGVPDGWTLATLNQLTLQITDVDHRMPKAVDRGIPYISTKDFTEDDTVDFGGAKKISLDDYEALSRKVRPSRGDLLLSRYGTVGEVRVVETDLPFQASYSVAIIKPIQGFDLAGYLKIALCSDAVQAQIQRDVRATAQPDLGLGHIREFVVPLPPAAEQRRIVAEVDSRLSIVHEVEGEVNASLKRARALSAAVLRRAYDC